MKSVTLLVGAFAIVVAAIFAGLFANSKQSGMFPPGYNNPGTRTVDKYSGTPGATQTAQNNEAAPLQNLENSAMPQLGSEYPIANQVVLAGCLLSQSGNMIVQRENQHAYQLAGNTSTLQASLGRWVEVAGHEQEQMPQAESTPNGNLKTVFVVQQLQQTGPECKEKLPITVAVPGEAGGEGYEGPITTTQSRRQPTSGTITSTGEQQAPGKHIGPAEQQTLPVQEPNSILQGAPQNLGRAGNTPFDAEHASQAVDTAHEAAKAAGGGHLNENSHPLANEAQSGPQVNQRRQDQVDARTEPVEP